MTNPTPPSADSLPIDSSGSREGTLREENTRSEHETSVPRGRSTEEQVTAYDHLWFRRRPLE